MHKTLKHLETYSECLDRQAGDWLWYVSSTVTWHGLSWEVIIDVNTLRFVCTSCLRDKITRQPLPAVILTFCRDKCVKNVTPLRLSSKCSLLLKCTCQMITVPSHHSFSGFNYWTEALRYLILHVYLIPMCYSFPISGCPGVLLYHKPFNMPRQCLFH